MAEMTYCVMSWKSRGSAITHLLPPATIRHALAAGFLLLTSSHALAQGVQGPPPDMFPSAPKPAANTPVEHFVQKQIWGTAICGGSTCSLVVQSKVPSTTTYLVEPMGLAADERNRMLSCTEKRRCTVTIVGMATGLFNALYI
jgi:hypothetical protein